MVKPEFKQINEYKVITKKLFENININKQILKEKIAINKMPKCNIIHILILCIKRILQY